jgi:hypothetical protein
VAEILRERAAGRTGPFILVGHSQGANNVIDMARALEPSHVTVDLLITLSPFMQNRVPLNVAKAINYYQAPGWGQPLEAEPGFRGKLVNVNLADDPTISHIGMARARRSRPKSYARLPPSNNGRTRPPSSLQQAPHGVERTTGADVELVADYRRPVAPFR